MQELNLFYAQYKNGSLSLKEAGNKISQSIFIHRLHYVGPVISDDTWSSLMLCLCQKIERLITVFDEARGTFDMYMDMKIKYLLCTLKRSEGIGRLYQQVVYTHCEASDMNELYECEPAQDEQSAISLYAVRQGEKLPQKYQLMLVIVMLKSVFSLTDSLIAQVSRLTDYGIQELRTLARHLYDQTRHIQKRIAAVSESRKLSYLYYIRALYEMRCLEEGSPLYEQCMHRAQFHKRALDRKNEYLQTHPLSPTNKLIAEKLSLKQYKVSRCLKRARSGILKKVIGTLGLE